MECHKHYSSKVTFSELHFHLDPETQSINGLMCFQLFVIHLIHLTLYFLICQKQKVVFCLHFSSFIGLTSSFDQYFIQFPLAFHYLDAQYYAMLMILNEISLLHFV